MSDQVPLLEVDALIAGYVRGLPIVHGVSIAVAPREVVTVIGPNGAGKSTLLKAIAGLLPVQAGAIRVYGRPVGDCRHRVAYLSQRSDLDWRFPADVRRLVMTGRYVHLGWLRRPTRADEAPAVTGYLWSSSSPGTAACDPEFSPPPSSSPPPRRSRRSGRARTTPSSTSSRP